MSPLTVRRKALRVWETGKNIIIIIFYLGRVNVNLTCSKYAKLTQTELCNLQTPRNVSIADRFQNLNLICHRSLMYETASFPVLRIYFAKALYSKA